MNDVGELKSFVRLHARAQRIPSALVSRVLAAVTHDGDGPGSWVHAWSAEGDRAARRDDDRRAAALFGMARFPYVDGPARQEALDASIRHGRRWSTRLPHVARWTVRSDRGDFTAYVSNADPRTRKPLLLVVGGIVSTKEQWIPLLRMGRRLGVTVAVTEMPSVGENTLRYGPDSDTMLSGLMDELATVADTADTFVLGLSFGGHLALSCRRHDPRIRAVGTVGAPLRSFFQDGEWWRQVPAVTQDTLAHLTGVPRAGLPPLLARLALTRSDLAALPVPVTYLASARDEVIPVAEQATVADLPRQVLRVFDDVHGAPRHLPQTRAALALAVCDWRGMSGVRPAILRTLLRRFPAQRMPPR